jgi:hypothetical protein
MEFILVHTPNGNLTPQTLPGLIEMGKQVSANPENLIPGAKMLAAYAAQSKMFMVCLWEAPSVDLLMPSLEQMSMMGFDTEVIPADKLGVKMEKLAKAMAAMK